jgi:hypothetical protein
MRLIGSSSVPRVRPDRCFRAFRRAAIGRLQLCCRVLGTDRYRGQCAAANDDSANNQGSHVLPQIHMLSPPLQSFLDTTDLNAPSGHVVSLGR